ncbi:MAG: hypothetical protein K9L56_15555, partial [Clostridiales bacterium]|nr:hypothetical protein [Clostridiales bacterium]
MINLFKKVGEIFIEGEYILEGLPRPASIFIRFRFVIILNIGRQIKLFLILVILISLKGKNKLAQG